MKTSAELAHDKIISGMARKNLTQIQAAKQIGISQPMLHKLIHPEKANKKSGLSFRVDTLDKVLNWKPRAK